MKSGPKSEYCVDTLEQNTLSLQAVQIFHLHMMHVKYGIICQYIQVSPNTCIPFKKILHFYLLFDNGTQVRDTSS